LQSGECIKNIVLITAVSSLASSPKVVYRHDR
jgi:hypothetical protein